MYHSCWRAARLCGCGETVAVGDVDAVIEPGAQNLGCLHAALLRLAMRPCDVSGVRRLAELSVAGVDTSMVIWIACSSAAGWTGRASAGART